MKRFLSVLLIGLLAAPAAHAWNASGHKTIALIAYQNLTPATKQRVDALLSNHPDYPKWTDGVAAPDRGRVAFVNASAWADQIRSDPRFHDDGQPATSRIPGLPEGAQARHAGWHSISAPFSTDNTLMRPPEEPNILTKLREFESFSTMPEETQIYMLPWLLHLVQDIHQPLNVVTWFTKNFRNGDRGGRLIDTGAGQDLHTYWDSTIGTGDSNRFLNELAATIVRRHPLREQPSLDSRQWLNESFELRTQVYSFLGGGTERDPAVFPDAYTVAARNIALERAATAGYRLAQFLNERL